VAVPFVNGFCFVIKRTVIDAIGSFDEERFGGGYCEENDYAIRADAAGFELAVVGDAYVYHAKSRSYGAEERSDLSRAANEVFREKHGAAEIEGRLAAFEDSPLSAIREDVTRLTAMPRDWISAVAGDAPPLRIAFILPGVPHGGSGGSHSVVQETLGLGRLGVPAQVLVPRWDEQRARAAYPEAGDALGAFDGVDDLAELVAGADVVCATHHRSLSLLADLRERGHQRVLYAYYVQDYEPFFSAPHAAREATESYTAVPDLLLFAKSRWLANIIAARHGLPVSLVQPSLDGATFNAIGRRDQPDGPLRVAAMVRPRTARRQPLMTVLTLSELRRQLGDAVAVTSFGCFADELREAIPGVDRATLAGHAGLLSRAEAGQLLRNSDVFLDLSVYQAFGRTALEAMACGCVPIVPQVGGVWEFALPGVNANTIDTLSPAAPIEAITALTRSREQLEELRAGALATAERFSVERAVVSEYALFAREHRARHGAALGPTATTSEPSR
jgi:glycosyltransferase involved in cell wall biosynthesis